MERNELEQLNWENTAAVIGGKGAWGKRMAEHLGRLGFNVIPIDRTEGKMETLWNNHLAIRASRIVCFSVWPIEAINPIIETAILLGDVKPDQIFLDNASVKAPIMASLKKLDSQGASVCSVHPLASPEKEISGQNVWLMDVGDNALAATSFAAKLFESMGMITQKASLDSHDEDMDFLQGAVHIRKRAEDLTLFQMGVDLHSLRERGTANFKLDEDSRRRTRDQDPEMSVTLIRSMLRHNRGREFIHTLIDNLQTLEMLIDQDPKEAIHIINESADFLKGGD